MNKSLRARITVRIENELFKEIKKKSGNISALTRDLLIKHLTESRLNEKLKIK